MTERNSKGWLTIEQLRAGLPEQAAVLGVDGITDVAILSYQEDAHGGPFCVTHIRRRGTTLLERHGESFARLDEARDRFTHTQRRFTRRP